MLDPSRVHVGRGGSKCLGVGKHGQLTQGYSRAAHVGALPLGVSKDGWEGSVEPLLRLQMGG